MSHYRMKRRAWLYLCRLTAVTRSRAGVMYRFSGKDLDPNSNTAET